MTRAMPVQRRGQQVPGSGGAEHGAPAKDGAASPIRQALRGTTFAEGERMLAPAADASAPVQLTPRSGGAAATTTAGAGAAGAARNATMAPRGARAAMDYYGTVPASMNVPGRAAPTTDAPRATSPHPAPEGAPVEDLGPHNDAEAEGAANLDRESNRNASETEVTPAADGDASEVSVGADVEHRRHRSSRTTLGAGGSVTLGREEEGGAAGVTSGEVHASAAHRTRPATITVGAAMDLARSADGTVTVGAEGSVKIAIRQWAELRAAARIDDQGVVTASGGLTISILRAMGERRREPPGSIEATLDGSVDSEGGATGQAGVRVTIPGS